MNELSQVQIWGDGTPLREFLHVDDLALACLTLINKFDSSLAINVGSGEEITIANLSKLIAKIVGFDGEINFNRSRPNGTPRKLLNSSRIAELGWTPVVKLESGIASTYDWFLDNLEREMKR